MICCLCGHEIAGAFVPHPYGPDVGPPAPMHYACRLREIYAREQDRRRLEAAAPALLEACRAAISAYADEVINRAGAGMSDEYIEREQKRAERLLRAAVALAEEGGPHP